MTCHLSHSLSLFSTWTSTVSKYGTYSDFFGLVGKERGVFLIVREVGSVWAFVSRVRS